MEYRHKFIQFTTPYLEQPPQAFVQNPLDWQLYHWLVSHMDRAQDLLGTYGVAHYRAAFDRFHVPNYPYILNTVPQIRMGQAERVDLLMCDDMMVRYIGAMGRVIDQEEKRCGKPFVWLQLGLQFYIGLPVRLLYWFGIISGPSFSRITSSQFFKVISGIGGLAAFLAALIQIMQAWPFVLSLF